MITLRIHVIAAILTVCVLAIPHTCAEQNNWTTRVTVDHQACNVSCMTKWDPAIGLHIKISSKDGAKSLTISLTPKEGKLTLEPKHKFPPSMIAGAQFNPQALPSNAMAQAELVIKFRAEIVAVYIENRPVAVFPMPFPVPATVAQLRKEIQEGEAERCRLQKIDDNIHFGDNFLVPKDQEEQLAAWEIKTGSWALHTAAQNAHTTRKGLEQERSPNFSSLNGAGTNAIITAGYEFYDAYSMEAAIRTEPGEMGVVLCFQKDAGYHAFTLKMDEGSQSVLLSLWRVQSTNNPNRKVIAAVRTDLTPNQWVKLKVKAFQNRVQCYMDNIQVIDTPAELPVGGQFGLFATSGTNGILFDDVLAMSNNDLDFMGVSDIRRHVIEENGGFLPKRRFFHLFPPRAMRASLKVSKEKKPQWLIVGSTAHRGHVFSADFSPSTDKYEIGLISGYASGDKPYFRFICKRDGRSEQFKLLQITGDKSSVLESLDLTIPEGQPGTVTLMSDATNTKELRLYRNEQLVLIYHLADPVKGASGLFVGPKTGTRISNPLYSFERRNFYRNKFEKNRNYVQDPFMRHWSSPEGQWLQTTNSLVWHKSDFFGAFLVRMPFIDGSTIHFGVPEGSTNGSLVVLASTAKGLTLADGPERSDDKAKAMSVLTGALVEQSFAPEGAEQTKEKWYTVHYESYWIWVTSGDKLLMKRSITTPLSGRRIRISGFSTEQLKYTYVERYNVKDYLFTESLNEWIANGGIWEVVNRFKCQPRWSHMNGESVDGPAALWTKFIYEGDFCVEMYAGIRHGWYKRAGDLNITIMNDDTTPSQGYTVTCTGWDVDHSQLYTKLYRNGKVIAETDKYLVPRNRVVTGWTALGHRRGHMPLIADGRPLHGAWYYIKFRRIGKRLEYYYDNELVFSVDDDEPIKTGNCGIWTYMNSMMVARVKIAAEKISPRPFSFTTVDISQLNNDSLSSADSEPSHDNQVVLRNGRPMLLTDPEYWQIDDPVGRSVLQWNEGGDQSPYFTLRNTLGSGTMYAKCSAEPVPLSDIAGWRFLVKRTTHALFNFHYSAGTIENGKYTPLRSMFHRISSTEFSRGSYRKSGATDVPPLQQTGQGWHKNGEWVPVTVWIPAVDRHGAFAVRVEGFGTLQPSYEIQGLYGNGPGEAYAIKDMVEIAYSAPTMTVESNAVLTSVSVLDPETGDEIVKFADISTAQDWLNKFEEPIFRGILSVELTNSIAIAPLMWVRPPDGANITCAWDKEQPGAFLLQSDLPYPDRVLAAARVTVAGHKVELSSVGTNRLRGLLPRDPAICTDKTDNVKIIVRVNKTTETTYTLPWKDNIVQEPPVLLNLEGPTPFLENFERRTMESLADGDISHRARLENFDKNQGTSLVVFNDGKPGRLKTTISAPVNLSRFPIFQFRYRAPGMAHISLALTSSYVVKLSEGNLNTATQVRYANDLTLDRDWHTWLGMVSDAALGDNLSANRFAVSAPSFASKHRTDQTGLFTEWNVDDIVFGPAIARKEDLAFTADYFDFDGVKAVHWAIKPGVKPYADAEPEERAKLKWNKVGNNQQVTPTLAGLSNGICHLLLKAEDMNSNESPVTDVPFLLDRDAIKVTHSLVKATKATGNDTELRVVFNTGQGAPLNLAAMKLKWNDTVVTPSPFGSTFIHGAKSETMTINWPFVFKKQLSKIRNGETNRIVLTGIADGAGNASPDVTIPIVRHFESDEIPPTLLAATMPTNILWRTAFEDPTVTTTYFVPKNAKITLVRPKGNEPHLHIKPSKKAYSLTYKIAASGQWQVYTYPYLALRIRRNSMPKDDPTHISIVLAPSKGDPYIIPLTGEDEGDRILNLVEPIVWRADTWYPIIVNVRDLIQASLEEAKFEELLNAAEVKDEKKLRIEAVIEEEELQKIFRRIRIGSLTIKVTDAEGMHPIDLQSVFIFAKWLTTDVVKMNAFDASGIGGIDWALEKIQSDVSLSPASVGPGLGQPGWIVMRVRDQAGNLSIPLHIPTHGNAMEPDK